ncbi:hypothetical protein EG328_010254 [Venturia inaequalis]|uniref:Tyrosinase copper-binding domain-containing protein n=1 Tax=Venturia inaequalis TaxID=5025 RepID=A0A8H3U6Y9_VENIN|nr:hypothetical protein EG328_010254 [Venturia inaequalis]
MMGMSIPSLGQDQQHHDTIDHEMIASKNRHDDFTSLHILHTTPAAEFPTPENWGLEGPGVHFNGVFLPWHRYTLWAFETVLIEECGYKGAQPYWDWTQDTPEHNTHFNMSPIFDSQYGFGGNGVGGSTPMTFINVRTDPIPAPDAYPEGTCIDSGPFNGMMHNTGPGFQLQRPNPRCLVRNIQTALADDTLQWKNDVMPILATDDYWNMSIAMDVPLTGKSRGVHGAAHASINGEMANFWSSTNDPLFFMHHSMLDYIWWTWQNKSPENLFAMGGPIYTNGTGTVTLDYTLHMTPFIAPDIPVRKVVDTLNMDRSGVLCYVYESNDMPVPP